MLQNTEKRVPLSCFTEVSCRTDGSRRWRIDFIQRCVSRCSMNAALGDSTFVCHLTTPRFRSHLFPIPSFRFTSVSTFFPPSSSFSIFLLFFFFFSFFTRSRVEIVADRGRIGELLSGMEFSELDSWKFLKAYNSN